MFQSGNIVLDRYGRGIVGRKILEKAKGVWVILSTHTPFPSDPVQARMAFGLNKTAVKKE